MQYAVRRHFGFGCLSIRMMIGSHPGDRGSLYFKNLSADLAHGTRFRADAVLEFVSNGFGPDGFLEKGNQILMSPAISQRISEVELAI